MAPGDDAPDWRELAQRKLAELDERIARRRPPAKAISHGLRCRAETPAQRPDFHAVCPDFQARITTRRAAGLASPRALTQSTVPRQVASNDRRRTTSVIAGSVAVPAGGDEEAKPPAADLDG